MTYGRSNSTTNDLSIFHTWLFIGAPPENYRVLYKYKGVDYLRNKHIFLKVKRNKKHEPNYSDTLEFTTPELYSLFHGRTFFPACYTTTRILEVLNALA